MNKQSGFSLIELLVVVAILGILAAAGSYAYGYYIKNAKWAVFVTNFESINDAIKVDIFSFNNGLSKFNLMTDVAPGTQALSEGVKCQDVAISAVYNLNRNNSNLTNPNLPTAVYGNDIVNEMGEMNRALPLGVIVISCVDPNDPVSNRDNDFRIYQCASGLDENFVFSGVNFLVNSCPAPKPSDKFFVGGPYYGW